MTFDKTVEALITEFSSDPWRTHDALLDEIETKYGIAIYGQFAAIVKKCEDRGLDSLKESTLSKYYKTARWVDTATTKQATVIRSRPPTAAAEAYSAGWLPGDLVAYINRGGATAKIRPSRQDTDEKDVVEKAEQAADTFARAIVAMGKADRLPSGSFMFLLMSLRNLLNVMYDKWFSTVEPDMDTEIPDYLPESWVTK